MYAFVLCDEKMIWHQNIEMNFFFNFGSKLAEKNKLKVWNRILFDKFRKNNIA